MQINLTLPGFGGTPPAPIPPDPPKDPPKQVDAARKLSGRKRDQQRAASIRNTGGAGGLDTGAIGTALKSLTGQ